MTHFTVRCTSFLVLSWLRLDWSTGTTSTRLRCICTRSRGQAVVQSHRDTFNITRREDA